MDQEFIWDQQEYVVVTGDCAGETIRHESRRQTPAGVYQISVDDKVLKEFVIDQNGP